MMNQGYVAFNRLIMARLRRLFIYYIGYILVVSVANHSVQPYFELTI